MGGMYHLLYKWKLLPPGLRNLNSNPPQNQMCCMTDRKINIMAKFETMNFVTERETFSEMVAVYQNGAFITLTNAPTKEACLTYNDESETGSV